MREPWQSPDFNRVIEEVTRARTEWNQGNRGRAESTLRMAGALAMADALERAPGKPSPIHDHRPSDVAYRGL